MCEIVNCPSNVVGIKIKDNKDNRSMCKADAELMKFAEIFEALPHGHADLLFRKYTSKVDIYRKKAGKGNVTQYENLECFKDALREIAGDIAAQQYRSVIND